MALLCNKKECAHNSVSPKANARVLPSQVAWSGNMTLRMCFMSSCMKTESSFFVGLSTTLPNVPSSIFQQSPFLGTKDVFSCCCSSRFPCAKVGNSADFFMRQEQLKQMLGHKVVCSSFFCCPGCKTPQTLVMEN